MSIITINSVEEYRAAVRSSLDPFMDEFKAFIISRVNNPTNITDDELHNEEHDTEGTDWLRATGTITMTGLVQFLHSKGLPNKDILYVINDGLGRRG